MKIIQLSAENVKKIKAVEITPEGNVVVIGGKNGAGKSSIIDAIEYALAGKGAQCPRPVRDGEEKAVIVLTLDDLIVTRIIKADGASSLVVSSRDGAKYGSPQAMLDKLVGKLTFDPLAFSRMEPREQVEVLKSLVNLDFAKIDRDIAVALQVRLTKINEIKGIENRLGKIPNHRDMDGVFAPVSVAALVQELDGIQKKNQAIQNADERASKAKALVDRLYKELEQAKMDLVPALGSREILGQPIDESPIRQRIADNESINQKIRENQARGELLDENQKAQKELAGVNHLITDTKDEKKRMLAEAQFPVAGLGFTEDGVTYNGLPFEQASSSEQLRISVAMGLALNPELKVLLIRDGSLLDEDNLRMMAEMAQEKDAQIWIERVSEGAECQVIMEDGEVAEQPF